MNSLFRRIVVVHRPHQLDVRPYDVQGLVDMQGRRVGKGATPQVDLVVRLRRSNGILELGEDQGRADALDNNAGQLGQGGERQPGSYGEGGK